jgi:hypothetical protein
MSGGTEIYICKPGQEIKQGKLEYGSIATREEATADAERRSRADSSIGLIAYYSVGEDGSFRSLYTYENKRSAEARRRRSFDGREPRPSGGSRKVAKKRSLLRRLLAAFS